MIETHYGLVFIVVLAVNVLLKVIKMFLKNKRRRKT